jgi:hypothetical protein
MKNSLDIIWQNQKVGRIENFMQDMWYVEGTWIADNSSKSNEFEKLVLTFDLKEVMKDFRKGTRAILVDKDNNHEINALIICMTDSSLFLRCVFDKEAAKWLLKNVK